MIINQDVAIVVNQDVAIVVNQDVAMQRLYDNLIKNNSDGITMYKMWA
jgi:phenylalanyl-tRNA synthetase beta subunit